MRLMITTALASAVMFAGPALAGGNKVEGTTGMTAPETSAAQLPGATGDSSMLRQHFESAGFSDWQPATDAEIFHMQSADGQPVWVLLMPENAQVGSAERGSGFSGQASEMAEAPGAGTGELNLTEESQQAEARALPQRGEVAGVGETFNQQAESGGASADEQSEVAEAELPETGDLPQMSETQGSASGTMGQTQPEGFAAQIPGDIRSGLEQAGFQQVESVDGADLFRARTDDGQLAFIIMGELGGAESGQEQVPGLDQQEPAAAPGGETAIPEITPGNVPAPTQPGQQ